MKTLILVRHAKSSHSFGVSSDFERPLNDRGFREASEMGKKLFKNVFFPLQFKGLLLLFHVRTKFKRGENLRSQIGTSSLAGARMISVN